MKVKAKVCPFLMFQGKAEEAMKFYASLIPGSEIGEVVRWGKGQPGAEGTVMKAAFTVGGQTVMCTDSVVQHGFSFTPSFSFWVTCDSEEEIRRLTAALSQDGNTLMPLGSYGFSREFAWVSDKFGVSWQLNLP
jgi:predicted 3-demethylubiquinone-9 3-methyltransferase (glyoxalase superfamily)